MAHLEESGKTAQSQKHSTIRIFTLGTFHIEWEQQLFPRERLSGRGAAPALGLLKALITRPDRFALRDWLMEQFWPESASSKADERLDDVASGLRTLLRPPESSAKILHFVYGSNGKGSGYRLESYPLMWVDADAFEWYVEQAARLDRFGHDSLPLWEHAYQLASRGEFLPEERYSDWAIMRRERLEGHYRQCVHRLVHLLQEAGAHEEALLRLRTYWQQYQTDEDALRTLLKLLGDRECYQEAEQYYEQAREALQREGQELDPGTRDVIEYVRVKTTHQKTISTSMKESKQALSHVLPSDMSATMSELYFTSSTSEQTRGVSHLSQVFKRAIIEAARELGGTSIHPISALTEKDDMDKKRRELFHLLGKAGIALTLPLPDLDWERIQDVLNRPLLLDEKVLQNLEAINRSLWELYVTTPMKSSVLDGALGQLKMLFQFLDNPRSPSNHKQLCALISETAQLVGEIFFDLNDYDIAQACYTLAAASAKDAMAYDLWACALVRNAFLPLYRGSYKDAFVLLHEAFKLSQRGNASLPTQYWVAAVEAEVQSRMLNLTACQKALDRAQGVQDVKVVSLPWVRFSTTRLPALRGACYIRLQQSGLAAPALQEALQYFTQPDRKRGMALTDLAVAATQQGEIEQAHAYVDEVIAIITLSSSSFLSKELRTLPQRLKPIAHTPSIKALEQYIGQQLKTYL